MYSFKLCSKEQAHKEVSLSRSPPRSFTSQWKVPHRFHTFSRGEYNSSRKIQSIFHNIFQFPFKNEAFNQMFISSRYYFYPWSQFYVRNECAICKLPILSNSLYINLYILDVYRFINLAYAKTCEFRSYHKDLADAHIVHILVEVIGRQHERNTLQV